jgi:hypothetical protein
MSLNRRTLLSHENHLTKQLQVELACICTNHTNILFKPDRMRRYLIRAFAGLFMESVEGIIHCAKGRIIQYRMTKTEFASSSKGNDRLWRYIFLQTKKNPCPLGLILVPQKSNTPINCSKPFATPLVGLASSPAHAQSFHVRFPAHTFHWYVLCKFHHINFYR